MNNGDSPVAQQILAVTDTAKCPGCGGPVGLDEKRCSHCGRPAAKSHGFFYHAFWVVLSLMVAALTGYVFYVGFQMLNRML
jgi:predicted amidophosphoribosyltransferase